MLSVSSEEFFLKMREEMEKASVDSMNVNESMMWFRRTIRDMGIYRHSAQIQNKMLKEGDFGAFPKFGHFNVFFYPDPKYKMTLPYYDILPIVIPLSYKLENGTFLGLNFHYLPYHYRLWFLKLLDNFLLGEDDEKEPDGGIIPITWNKVRNIRFPKYCVKRYIHSRIKSKIRYIRSKDFKTLVMLPIQQFYEVDRIYPSQKVYREVK